MRSAGQLPSTTSPDALEAAYIELACATVGNGLHKELATPLKQTVRRRLIENLPLSGEQMINIYVTASREVQSGRMNATLFQKCKKVILDAD